MDNKEEIQKVITEFEHSNKSIKTIIDGSPYNPIPVVAASHIYKCNRLAIIALKAYMPKEPCEHCSKKAFARYWKEDKEYLCCPFCGRKLEALK